MYIQEAIKNIAEKKLDEMKQNVYAALSEKAMEKLEEKKIDMAKAFFVKKKEEEDDDDKEGEDNKKDKNVKEEYAKKSPASEGKEAAKKDDEMREKHMMKYDKSPKRLTGELADKFMNKKSKG